jgi:hypothetical protein
MSLPTIVPDAIIAFVAASSKNRLNQNGNRRVTRRRRSVIGAALDHDMQVNSWYITWMAT